jgi:thymidylate kinase
MSGAIPHAVARAEQALYNKMRFPDYLLVLNVSPKTSLERKPDHHPAAIEAKNELIRRLSAATAPTLSRTRLIHLDAGQPLEEVISEIKRAVWKIL